ncbi:MAG: ABC transporter substrate-binding protein [Alkalilacustris sp.]
MSRGSGIAVLLAAALLMLPVGTQPLAAQSMTVAYPFGVGEPVPDPRARFNGWFTNRAGITETLMGLDHDMQLVPRLAEGIEAVDPTTWRVTLRAGLRFHDGTPVTTDAVVASIEAIGQEGHPAHNPQTMALMELEGIAAEGERSVVFRTRAPNADFPHALADANLAIVGAPSDAFPINGTGPFFFREAVPNQLLRVTANPDFRDGPPRLEELRFVAIPDAATASLAFEAGEVDIVTNVSEADFPRLAARDDVQSHSEATTRLFFLIPNTASGPLADARIRRALSLGIDREAIVAAALNGVGGVAAGTLFPATMPWAADVPPAFDPDRAAALLDEAGAVMQAGRRMWNGAPLRLSLWTYEGRAALRPSAELVQAYLGQLGIDVSIRIAEYEANNDALRSGEADLTLQAWGTAPQGNPGYFPETLLASDGGHNLSGWQNAEVDRLLAEGRATFDTGDRLAIYHRMQRIAVEEEAALIPLFHSTQLSVARMGVEGFRIHPSEVYLAHPGLGFAD